MVCIPKTILDLKRMELTFRISGSVLYMSKMCIIYTRTLYSLTSERWSLLAPFPGQDW